MISNNLGSCISVHHERVVLKSCSKVELLSYDRHFTAHRKTKFEAWVFILSFKKPHILSFTSYCIHLLFFGRSNIMWPYLTPKLGWFVSQYRKLTTHHYLGGYVNLRLNILHSTFMYDAFGTSLVPAFGTSLVPHHIIDIIAEYICMLKWLINC